MKIMERISLILAWIACAGMITPVAVFGQQPKADYATRIQDVALSSGVFTGQVVDHQGNALANTAIVVGQQGTQVAKAVTNANGRFQVSGLNGGVYQIAAGNAISVCRVWHENAAPPIATDGLLVVSDANIVRGQCNTCNTGGYAGGGYAGGGYAGGGYGVGAPVAGGPVQGGPVQGGPVAGAPGGYVVNGPGGGGYVGGGYADGAIVDGGACGPACCPPEPCGKGGGVLGLIANPWFVGAVVAAAIAIPLAVNDDDDDDAS